MTLIKSISGIRGTIGGQVGDNLTPIDIVKFASAYGSWLKHRSARKKVVIGRDGRISGEMVSQLVTATLRSLGLDVLDLGLSTTPTVEMAVVAEDAGGGIILTASHNPVQWNALKLLNEKGEFISAADGQLILDMADEANFEYAEVFHQGAYEQKTNAIENHIEQILALPLVDTDAISFKDFKIVVDCINSTGALAIPPLLVALGIENVIILNGDNMGYFAHTPEPLPENLTQISEAVRTHGADLGIVVDPDVDRLALVCEDGSMFGEEYTLVAVADYILQYQKGNTVSNLSSSRALRDVTEAAGGEYFASSVGEVNVVAQMKACNAVIGGEGNGGIIYPELHYGRDALVGIAFFLSHLAKSGKTCKELRATYPDYFISKNKISLLPKGDEAPIDVDKLLNALKEKYQDQPHSMIDGLKINWDDTKEWAHIRKSNTEPIIRIYCESGTAEGSQKLFEKIAASVDEILKS